MEQKNKSGIIIGILIGVIIVLTALVILFATDTISFKINKDNNNENNSETSNNENNIIDKDTNEETDNNNQTDKDDNNTTQEDNKNKTIINNNSIDSETLNKLLDIIGISINDENVNNCLNMAVSKNNYKENKLVIFSWAVNWHKFGTYHYGEKKCQEYGECAMSYSCGGCSSILKTDAHKILKKYDFNIDEIEFLRDMPSYDDEYHYVSSSCCGSHCPYYIEHNINTEIKSSLDIRLIDIQTVSEYGESGDDFGKIINTKKQTVTYEFKKDETGNYYLSNVEVK